MPEETFQLVGNAPGIYEYQKVPSIFGPLAEATLDLVAVHPDDVILDIACGTGIVARTVRRRLGPSPRIVGVDLNEGMIATARNLSDEASRSCEWHVGDATNLPFEAETFSVAFCQQGIQFFPDDIAALREAKRVLRPGGRIVLSVWSGASALFRALAEALARHVGKDVGLRSLAPFAYSRGDTLGSLLAGQGFGDVAARVVTVDRVIADPVTAIPKEIMGNPVGPIVARQGEVVMRNIVNETIAALTQYRRGSAFVIPTHSHLIQARVG